MAYSRTTRIDLTVSAYNAHLARHPRDYRAWSDMGVCYMTLRLQGGTPSYLDAIRCFRKALVINPFRRKTWLGLLVAYRETRGD